jgi:site-specific DNA-adenine methylase
MQYFGGKFRIAKQLAEFLNTQKTGLTEYYEPFCGDCNVILYITALPRRASDGSSAMIALWKAMQDGWSPPTVISEEQYRRACLEW